MVVPPYGQSAPAGSYPYPGEAGSTFSITDDQNGNPITKIVLQNIRVLRVIAGDVSVNDSSETNTTAVNTSDPATTPSAAATATPAAAAPPPAALPNPDMLVLEVNPQQAELITFLENNEGKYQVVLRSPDDHATATTTGVTYDQMMSTYGLPAPKPVKLPGGGQ
ncbi:MAG TPA: hypothetical protein VHV31_11975 [Nitrolancea sp.]|nr:hypothetical protein [Nitrolancea sp.]